MENLKERRHIHHRGTEDTEKDKTQKAEIATKNTKRHKRERRINLSLLPVSWFFVAILSLSFSVSSVPLW
jgi:hypothetical protein